MASWLCCPKDPLYSLPAVQQQQQPSQGGPAHLCASTSTTTTLQLLTAPPPHLFSLGFLQLTSPLNFPSSLPLHLVFPSFSTFFPFPPPSPSPATITGRAGEKLPCVSHNPPPSNHKASRACSHGVSWYCRNFKGVSAHHPASLAWSNFNMGFSLKLKFDTLRLSIMAYLNYVYFGHGTSPILPNGCLLYRYILYSYVPRPLSRLAWTPLGVPLSRSTGIPVPVHHLAMRGKGQRACRR